MIRGQLTGLLLALLTAAPSAAETQRPAAPASPEATAAAPAGIRPRARPEMPAPRSEAATAVLARAIAAARTRPQLRPPSEQSLARAALGTGRLAFAGIERSVRPWARPDSVVREAMAKRRLRRKGAVCGDIDILGERVGRVPGRGACGIKDAVRLRSVAGVTLTQPALLNCRTAKALKTWVEKDVTPAFGRRDRLVGLKVAAHYACRTRNNRPGAKLSEHARGNAIDISGFVLASGRIVTVLEGWNAKTPLKRIHRAACARFGTVLGPGSDGYHRDHFHLDTAQYRSGPFCR